MWRDATRFVLHPAGAFLAGAVSASAGACSSKHTTCQGNQTPKGKTPAHALDSVLMAGKPVVGRVVGQSREVESVIGGINYMSKNVPTGLYAKRTYPPAVGVSRDLEGNDVEVFGVEVERIEAQIDNSRDVGLNLDSDGVQLVPNTFLPIDYSNVDEVVRQYYPECCRLVKESMGARRVFAFDHNLRSPGRKGEDAGAGFKVQPPLQLVHADYTEESAIRRIRDLTKPATKNDIFYSAGSGGPLIAEDAEDIFQHRFCIVNVWRSIHPEPIERDPLGFLSPGSCPDEDLIMHEIHYNGRVGENYNARHGQAHKWWYYPGMDRSEAVLFKTWDSAGQFCRWPAPGPRVPATFVLHSAFEVPVREEAPDRESIEVRCIVLF